MMTMKSLKKWNEKCDLINLLRKKLKKTYMAGMPLIIEIKAIFKELHISSLLSFFVAHKNFVQSYFVHPVDNNSNRYKAVF